MRKVFFILFVTINLFISHLQAQTTSIPDTSFEQKLIQLGIDSDGLVNGQILNSDAVVVTKLDLSNSNIQSLAGIDAFVSLDTLRCGNNQIANLDLSSNNNLTRLLCVYSNITTLNLSGNSALKYLDCSYNQLSNLDLSNNPVLEYLDCANNPFTQLNLSNNPALEYLGCTNTNLTHLDLFNQVNLTKLYCWQNQLVHLNVSNSPLLEDLFCYTNQLTSLDLSSNPNLKQLDCSRNKLRDLNLLGCTNLWWLWARYNKLSYIDLTSCIGANVYDYDLRYNQPGLKICLVSLNQFTLGGCLADPSTVFSEDCFPLSIVGKIVIDDNNNCTVDSAEYGGVNHIIQFANNTDTFYFSSYDSLGHYKAYLDTGSYIITVIPSVPYVQPCPTNQVIVIDTTLQQVDWTLQATHYCPYLEASLSAPFLRMTGGGSNYSINYSNKGTAPAYDAYIEVEIDTFLNVIGSSIPILNQVDNKYTFDLDTIDVGKTGAFTINVIVDTSAQIGQTHCSNVHIYPDSLCNNTWAGPFIQTEGICNDTGIVFEIKNIGNNMTFPLQYSIFEDLIVLLTNPYSLNGGTNLQIPIIPQPGKTYRIEAEQAVGFPNSLGSQIAHYNIQNCNGATTQPSTPLFYYNGNPAAWIDNDCQANISSYDPNDKKAQSLGYGTAHYIKRAIPLDYKVRFQNTGTDTAFNIVILDTISPHLNLSTLQMKASSHNYTWEIIDGNTLKITFANIKLVDSLTNEPLSHGFFRYEIQQKINLPLGTIIENTAAIYFDYNFPIFTNTTFHTIGENFVLISINKIWKDELDIKVYPNPFHQMTTIEIKDQSFELLELQITDVAGRTVKHKQVQNKKKISVYRNDLPSGIYFYQLKGDHKLLGTGKLILH